MPTLKEARAGAATLYNEPGFQTDGAPTNSLLSRSLDARVSKNVLVSTGESYLTAQEAIDNAFPAGLYRDTVALRGFQSTYELGENDLIIDGTGASFSPDDGANIGLFGESATAFNHALRGGSYAGGIVYTGHNGGTANRLTITDVDFSDSSKFNIILSKALGGGLVDVIDLVRVRGAKTIIAGNTYGNGLINFSGNTYQDHRPVRLNLLDCDLSNTAGPLFAGIAPRGTKIYLLGTTKVAGSTANNLQRVRSVDAPDVTPVAYANDEIIVDERGSGTPGTPTATPFGPLTASGNAGETFPLPAGTKSVRGVQVQDVNPQTGVHPGLAITSGMYTLDTTATPPTLAMKAGYLLSAGDTIEGIAFTTGSSDTPNPVDPDPDPDPEPPTTGDADFSTPDFSSTDFKTA